VIRLNMLQPAVGDFRERRVPVAWLAQVVLVQQELELLLSLLLVRAEPVELLVDRGRVLALAFLPVHPRLPAPHGSLPLAEFLALHPFF
jgi:hypothetical protein